MWQIKKCSILSSRKPITSKLGRLATKDDRLSSIKSYDLFAYLATNVKTKTFIFSSTTYDHQTFRDRRFGWRTAGYQVILILITRSLVNWKIQIIIQIFMLQDSTTTKCWWKETYNKTWCHQIMLSTTQRCSALGTLFLYQFITDFDMDHIKMMLICQNVVSKISSYFLKIIFKAKLLIQI